VSSRVQMLIFSIETKLIIIPIEKNYSLYSIYWYKI